MDRKHDWTEVELGIIFALYMIFTWPYQLYLVIKDNRLEDKDNKVKEKFCGCTIYDDVLFRYCDFHRMGLW